MTFGLLTLNKTAGVDALAGPLTVLAAATARLLQSNQAKDTVYVSVASTLDLNGSTDTVISLTGTGGVTLTTAGSGLGVGGYNTSTTFAGTFAGGGTLTQVGTGTLALTDTLALTGSGGAGFTTTTTVSAGTLVISADNAGRPSL